VTTALTTLLHDPRANFLIVHPLASSRWPRRVLRIGRPRRRHAAAPRPRRRPPRLQPLRPLTQDGHDDRHDGGLRDSSPTEDDHTRQTQPARSALQTSHRFTRPSRALTLGLARAPSPIEPPRTWFGDDQDELRDDKLRLSGRAAHRRRHCGLGGSSPHEVLRRPDFPPHRQARRQTSFRHPGRRSRGPPPGGPATSVVELPPRTLSTRANVRRMAKTQDLGPAPPQPVLQHRHRTRRRPAADTRCSRWSRSNGGGQIDRAVADGPVRPRRRWTPSS